MRSPLVKKNGRRGEHGTAGRRQDEQAFAKEKSVAQPPELRFIGLTVYPIPDPPRDPTRRRERLPCTHTHTHTYTHTHTRM